MVCIGKQMALTVEHGLAPQPFKSWMLTEFVCSYFPGFECFSIFHPFDLLACFYNPVVLVNGQLVNIFRKVNQH